MICPFRALLHGPTWADKRRVFESAPRRSSPADASHGSSSSAPSRFPQPRHEATRGGPWQLIEHVPADNRIDLTRGHSERDGRKGAAVVGGLNSEWEGLIAVSGFEVEALYGWFDRRPFDDASVEFVWVARKPGK